MYYIIYKTTNKIDGKIYVGAHKTENLNDDYLGSGKHLLRAIDKHGIENFFKEILYVFDTPEEMYEKEKELVCENFIKDKNTYNIKVGGFGGWDHISWKGKKRSIETRKKLSEIKKKTYIGENNPFYGKSHTEETKNKIGAASKQRAKRIYNERIKEGNHPNNTVICPHCNKNGQYRAMKRWHFENCKQR